MSQFEIPAPILGRSRSGRRSTRSRGFTLVETVVTASVLLIGLLALTMTLVATSSLRRSEQDRNLAQNALRSIVEQIHAISDAAIDDPGGWSQTIVAAFSAGGNPGDVFAVDWLTPPDGVAGTASVQIVVDETLTDGEIGIELGMPRDLEGDGLATNIDVTATARLLPVVVQLRWTGAAGDRLIEQGFYILGY